MDLFNGSKLSGHFLIDDISSVRTTKSGSKYYHFDLRTKDDVEISAIVPEKIACNIENREIDEIVDGEKTGGTLHIPTQTLRFKVNGCLYGKLGYSVKDEAQHTSNGDERKSEAGEVLLNGNSGWSAFRASPRSREEFQERIDTFKSVDFGALLKGLIK